MIDHHWIDIFYSYTIYSNLIKLIAEINNDLSDTLIQCKKELVEFVDKNFYRVTLLKANNSIFNYNIISMCKTSLDEFTTPGNNFLPWNNPDGSPTGGVGIFFKEHLPLLISTDRSFDECLSIQ